MMTKRDPSAAGMALRTAVILFVFVVLFTALLSAAYLWTQPAIEASAAAEKMRLVSEVLAPEAYDNDLLKDTVALPADPLLGTDEQTTAYRARKDGKVTALVLEAIAPDGYAGRIRLILAINADHSIAGVRVTQHKETPGLGDYIEPKKGKDKANPWIAQFDGLQTQNMTDREWKVKKEGGRFDFMAGATVTPRAVIKAVRKATQFVASHHDTLYAPETANTSPAQGRSP